MPKASRLDWKILLSHSLPQNLDRCVVLSVGKSRIHLCARCIGLYPATALGLFGRLGDIHLPVWTASTVSLALPLIGALAWVVEQAGLPLNKIVRVLSGILLGAGLGWVLGQHLQTPWPPEMARLGGIWGLALAAGLLLRRLKRSAKFIQASDLEIDWENEALVAADATDPVETSATLRKHSPTDEKSRTTSASPSANATRDSKKSIVEG